MEHKFDLTGGGHVRVSITEHGDCINIRDEITLTRDGPTVVNCKVTCQSTGKSFSWTCPDGKNCEGDCRDPHNPTGKCV
jgi:hypothetical protein